MKKIHLYIALISLICSSCKKIIDIDTTDAAPQIVIEGKISDQLEVQRIIISKTVSYNSESNFPKVSGATVTVKGSNGSSFTFIENSPGVYIRNMRGISGVTYSLQVNVEGKTYTASSKMPNLVKLDSIGIVTNNFFGSETKIPAAYFVDPANETNFYHFNLYINNLFQQRVYVSNDRLTNGNKIRIQLFHDNEDEEELQSGDKVSVEMEDIDTNIYDYWYSLSAQDSRGPNQGTTPSNPPSNLSNNALGYFSAHTYQKQTITLP
ncbi:DUF4249 domain-containing protein [Pedobacter sp. MW01-1-1]|uniref:DUF4249 domain-containing protein n=1 Tax=Pedobacter sp. MW01-1-1 TaxID=3383027 RepID=UPI003FEEA598